MKITLVKKIKLDGSPCRKCVEVEDRLRSGGLINKIDNIIIADERDTESEGMQLAKKYQVNQAPFFIVERDEMEPEIYTVYFRFVKEVLGSDTSEHEEAKDILDQNPDLDYI